jgi:OOP family OmpA-OmpF porin
MKRFMKPTSLLISITALLGSAATLAASMPEKDVEGAKDNPMLSRYAGSVIVGYSKKAFDETDLISGRYKRSGANTLPFEKIIHVEGAVTRIAYLFPEDRSALEVMRNYSDALGKANMSIVFSCDKSACGADADGNGSFSLNFPEAKISPQLENWPDFAYAVPFNDASNGSRYVLAKSAGADGAVTYAAVYVVPPSSDRNGAILVETVQPAPMQTGKVSVNLSANEMAKSIGTDGRVALYGLQFDTDKAELRTDSRPSLIEIAKLLSQDPKLNVFVVGHTDNQGSYAHNIELSQKRSDAIVHALTTEFKIAPGRLVAKGIASVSPIASNDGETGRAKNRRVELVKQ